MDVEGLAQAKEKRSSRQKVVYPLLFAATVTLVVFGVLGSLHGAKRVYGPQTVSYLRQAIARVTFPSDFQLTHQGEVGPPFLGGSDASSQVRRIFRVDGPRPSAPERLGTALQASGFSLESFYADEAPPFTRCLMTAYSGKATVLVSYYPDDPIVKGFEFVATSQCPQAAWSQLFIVIDMLARLGQ